MSRSLTLSTIYGFALSIVAMVFLPAYTFVPVAPSRHATQVTPTSIPAVTANSQWTPVVQNFDGVDMVLVPAGCFMMGTENGPLFEEPVTPICFDKPFWIDKYEVTNVQFSRLGGVAAIPSRWKDANQPRESVNWFEARDYCQARGGYLPTEAEWEYAARGPDHQVYPWGNTFVAENVVFSDNSGGTTAPVGSKPNGASWVGALDMSGNVGEWTSSMFKPYPYNAADGREDGSAATSNRVLRGGTHADGSVHLRAADRQPYRPLGKGWLHGMRCARALKGVPSEGKAILIDDFESGTLANWKIASSGSGNWYIYSDGNTPPNPAHTDRNVPFKVPRPPQGKFAAITDMDAPGTRILYRDLKLDGRYTLRLIVFYVNMVGGQTTGHLFSPDTLGYSSISNQQYRIDLIKPSAAVDTVAQEDILATIFRTSPKDPDRLEPTVVRFDLSPWEGQTVRLRLANVDNQDPLRAGVDDIRLEVIDK